jgi:hypothetical protein
MQDENIQNIIKSRLAELPPELQKAITAADLPMKFDGISKKFGLRIDQSGYLQTETLLVMLGLEKAGDFMQNLVTNGELTRPLAKAIADEVNNQIFSSIRSSLREMESVQEEETAGDNETDLEKAGNLVVERPVADQTSSDSMDKANILNSIENTDAQPNMPINMLEPMVITQPAPSPLVSRLMTAPVTSTNETVEKKPATSSRPGGPDPYREPIE